MVAHYKPQDTASIFNGTTMCQSTAQVLEFTYSPKAKALVTTARTPVQDKLSRTKAKPMCYCDQYL